MKSASPALISHLVSQQQFLMADLFVFTLVGGHSLYMTTWESSLVVDGDTYAPWNIKRSRIRNAVGLEVDTLDIELYPQAGDTINNVPFLLATRRGALDGATVDLYRLFMPVAGDTSLGKLHRFAGSVADYRADRSGITLTVKSVLEKLNVQLPRNQFQSGCTNTLFDSNCGLPREAWVGLSTVGSIGEPSTDYLDIASALPLALGVVKFTSGVNAGLTRSIREYKDLKAYFAVPLPVPCAVGDFYSIYPGCDKRLSTCDLVFGNRPRFRGYPFVPAPETAL